MSLIEYSMQEGYSREKHRPQPEGAGREIGIGGSLATPPLPHHRTCGSASGGSAKLAKQNFALGDFSFR